MTVYTYPFGVETIVVDLENPPYLLFRDLKLEITRTLMQAVEYVFLSGVNGHIAEFGTATGLTATSLAMALAKARSLYGHIDQKHGLSSRNLYLFDSFQGLPQAKAAPDQFAPHVVSGIWGPGACKALNAEQLRDMVSGHIENDAIRIFEGWYQDTLPHIPPGVKFALVHLDCDLYESTFQVLDHLLAGDHLSPGCLLFFDDWNCNHGSSHYGQRRAWEECVEKYHPRFEDLGDYGCMSHRILVQDPKPLHEASAGQDRLSVMESEIRRLADQQNNETRTLLAEMTSQLSRYQKITANLEQEISSLKNEIAYLKTGKEPGRCLGRTSDQTVLGSDSDPSAITQKINEMEQTLTLQGNRQAAYKKRIQSDLDAFGEKFHNEISQIQKELKRLTANYESNRRIDRQVLESFQAQYQKDREQADTRLTGFDQVPPK